MGNEAKKGRDIGQNDKKADSTEARFMSHYALCNEIDFLIPLMSGWQQKGIGKKCKHEQRCNCFQLRIGSDGGREILYILLKLVSHSS